MNEWQEPGEGGRNWKNRAPVDQQQACPRSTRRTRRKPTELEGRHRQRREFCNRPPQWPMRRRRKRVVVSLCRQSSSDCPQPARQYRRWKGRCKTSGQAAHLHAEREEYAAHPHAEREEYIEERDTQLTGRAQISHVGLETTTC